MNDDINELKDKMATAIAILRWEISDMWGHVSARTPDGSGFLLRHIRPPENPGVSLDDVLQFDLEGNLLSGKRNMPDEMYFYTCPYQQRKEVGAVIHCHPPMALSLAAAGRKIIPITQSSVEFGREVPLSPWLYGSWREHGEQAVSFMGGNCALMILGHGALVVGESIEQACIHMVHLERTAKMILLAATAGQPTPLSPEVVQQFLSVVGSSSTEIPPEKRSQVRLDLEWRYYQALVKSGEKWNRL